MYSMIVMQLVGMYGRELIGCVNLILSHTTHKRTNRNQEINIIYKKTSKYEIIKFKKSNCIIDTSIFYNEEIKSQLKLMK